MSAIQLPYVLGLPCPLAPSISQLARLNFPVSDTRRLERTPPSSGLSTFELSAVEFRDGPIVTRVATMAVNRQHGILSTSYAIQDGDPDLAAVSAYVLFHSGPTQSTRSVVKPPIRHRLPARYPDGMEISDR
ncbi:hypothetical protein PAXINDRAFT_15082 [Paxillus involutus ATCC 200175]|uniref:Uncharacterized protein n=1 Tax=Paxillus involutus ATCC 200175 TaxID=664439 RepID=A0A0C9T8R4_PAXIN|nr:hypothetical protein PAXINDRAFT_15082 [Paxillus involutus ATCC 200175]